jgi:hypothetical protein
MLPSKYHLRRARKGARGFYDPRHHVGPPLVAASRLSSRLLFVLAKDSIAET